MNYVPIKWLTLCKMSKSLRNWRGTVLNFFFELKIVGMFASKVIEIWNWAGTSFNTFYIH